MAQAHHHFVARAFAFVDESRADPPDAGMEPEDRLHRHVQRREEIIAPAHVRDLVRQNRGQLLIVQEIG